MVKGARIATSLLAGLVFGFGLALSGMLDPSRVRGFLDISGQWDPSLVFVLGGAVSISALGYWLSLRLSAPALDQTFHLPAKTAVDQPLIVGSALFGIGWGLSGLCPGPAIASLSLGIPATLVFTAAMFGGVLLHDHWPAADQPARVLE